jgi:hypothetical protein
LGPESIPAENNVFPESIAVGDFYTENIFNNSLTSAVDCQINFADEENTAPALLHHQSHLLQLILLC